MKGQVAMSLVFLVGGIMIIIGSTMTFVMVSFLNSTYGFRAANQALSLASTGVNDAMLHLTRNKNFSDTGYCAPSSACGSGTALVVVTQNTPAAGQVSVISSATVENRQRKIRAIFAVSTTTGQVNLVAWEILK